MQLTLFVKSFARSWTRESLGLHLSLLINLALSALEAFINLSTTLGSRSRYLITHNFCKCISLFRMPFIFARCASAYRPVNPMGFPYGDAQYIGDSLRISYVNDIQRLTQNKRYATKELRRDMLKS